MIPQNQYPRLQSLQNQYIQPHQYLPYELNTQIQIQFVGTSTFRQMLNQSKYDKQIVNQLNQINPQYTYQRILDQIVYIFVADMQPQNMQWTFWRHPRESKRFLKLIQPEIIEMEKYSTRKNINGNFIKQKYEKLKNKYLQNDNVQSKISSIVEFCNQLGKNPFLSKTVPFLEFVNHCLPLHLWNMKIYQHVPIFHQRKYLTKLIYEQFQIKQYLTVTQNGVILSTKNLMDSKIDQMIPFTNQFQFTSIIQNDDELHFSINACSRENIKVSFKHDYISGLNFHIGMKRAMVQSGYMNTQSNRFSSFSMPRKNCLTKLYNDGCQYFSDVYDQLEKAQKQVFITDWWLSPYILLKRNTNQKKISIKKNQDRLDKVLTRLAQKGVKIYIILFREPLGLVCNDSQSVQFHLEYKSPNIRVRRHPIFPQLWSHHQKCIVIDQKVGFMGGIDLCFGRWDTPDHFITNVNNYWDGGDYTNERLRAYAPGTTLNNCQQSPINRETQCRMPWHDIALMIRGDAVIDLARHFIQYWYFVDAQRSKDFFNHFRNLQRRYRRAQQYVQPELEQKKIYVYHQNTEQIQYQQTTIQNDGCLNKVSLFGKRTKLFFTGGTQNKIRQLLVQGRQGQHKGEQQLQLCRSASPWSIGAKVHEPSIHQAYQALIKESEHLIYIQNQFFMGEQNKIVECLAQRIRLAYKQKKNFKIVVVMPLLPGFDGDIWNRANGPLRFQCNNQYLSINRGQNSLYKKLQNLIKQPDFNIDDYVYFFGLRGHAILQGKPRTEIIYVHSKLMIVDDKRAIIGSANINDRSLLGLRDSQLAIVVQQQNGQLKDGRPRRKQIFDLRVRLFNQHFGLSPQQTARSNHPEIWAKIINQAKRNTLIYRELFGCYPDDTFTVSTECEVAIKNCQDYLKNNPKVYEQKIKYIVGHAVQFPLHFLEDQDLSYNFADYKQGLVLEKQMFL